MEASLSGLYVQGCVGGVAGVHHHGKMSTRDPRSPLTHEHRVGSNDEVRGEYSHLTMLSLKLAPLNLQGWSAGVLGGRGGQGVPHAVELLPPGASGWGTHLDRGQGDADADEILEGDDASQEAAVLGPDLGDGLPPAAYRTAISQQA